MVNKVPLKLDSYSLQLQGYKPTDDDKFFGDKPNRLEIDSIEGVLYKAFSMDAHGGLKSFINNNITAENEIHRVLNDLAADLSVTKDGFRQQFLPADLGGNSRIERTVNVDNPLYYSENLLRLIHRLAKSDSHEVSDTIRDKAQAIMAQWVNLNFRTGSTVITAKLTGVVSPTDANSLQTALKAILCANTEAQKLRGVTSILALAAKEGHKEEALRKYCDKIALSFQSKAVGEMLARRVEEDVHEAIANLAKIKQEPGELMDLDPTLVKDFNKAVADISLSNINNELANRLHAVLVADHDTKGFEAEIDDLQIAIEAYSEPYRYEIEMSQELNKEIARLEAKKGEAAEIKYEFMTSSQITQALRARGETRTLTREAGIGRLKELTQVNSGVVIVETENISLASRVHRDVNKKITQLAKSMNELTKPIRESMRDFPELANSLRALTGHRFGLIVEGSIHKDPEDLLSGKQEKLLREKVINEMNAELESYQQQLESLKTDRTTLGKKALGFKKALLETYASFDIQDADIERMAQELISISQVRTNSHAKRLGLSIHALKDLNGNLTDDESFKLEFMHNLAAFLEQEIELNRNQPNKEDLLQTTIDNLLGASKLDRADFPKLQRRSENVRIFQVQKASVDGVISSLESKIDDLNNGNDTEKLIEDRMRMEFSKKYSGSQAVLEAMGIVNIETRKEGLRAAAEIVEQGDSYDYKTTQTSLFKALQDMLNYLILVLKGTLN